MPKVIANNYETHYELDDFTDPWKPAETIVIQHGLGRSYRFWYHWVPLLARHYRVIRRDMRGHGQSADPGPNQAWSVEELLTDIKGFLDALNLDRVHYVGESIGGLLGIACAVRWPERFKSLTLCAGAIKIPPSVQRHFAVGYADWHTALGALGDEKALTVPVQSAQPLPAPVGSIVGTSRLGPRLFEPGGATLEDVVLHVWEDLAAEGRAVCPVCRGSMSPSADGGCRACGSELS